jgi:hypothetical protein
VNALLRGRKGDLVMIMTLCLYGVWDFIMGWGCISGHWVGISAAKWLWTGHFG